MGTLAIEKILKDNKILNFIGEKLNETKIMDGIKKGLPLGFQMLFEVLIEYDKNGKQTFKKIEPYGIPISFGDKVNWGSISKIVEKRRLNDN